MKYKLEIDTLYDLDSGGTTHFYSKGHQDIQKFITEASEEYDVIIKPIDVRHSFMRWEFAWGKDGLTHCGQEYFSSGRGIFPVTITNKWIDVYD